MPKRREKIYNGFTLVELLVVIGVIAVILGISIFGIRGVRESSRDTKRKADLETIRSALELYRSDNDAYPSSTDCSWGTHWPTCGPHSDYNWIPQLVPNYISRLPDDVRRNDSWIGDTPHTFSYNYRAQPLNCNNTSTRCTGYHLLTQLEDLNDSAINGTQISASYTGPGVYVVTNP